MHNPQRRQELRVALAPGQRAHQNRQRRQECRSEMIVEEQEAQRERERAHREAKGEDVQEAGKEALRIRRKCVWREHALANHEAFDKDRVSGKDVEDGQHNLPNMHECGWCLPGSDRGSPK
ncbi:hypothetical protein DVH05_009590 [Phytophthora capsici]|nr:hypothetical protein DVH05_009590 [Phytophthora capsici]